MPYNPEIDDRIRAIVMHWPGIESKKMFGGVGHLLNGHMVCGVYKDFLILRLGEKPAEKALEKEHVHHFDITGRPMKGWVMVTMEGCPDSEAMKKWLNQARRFIETLPPK